MRILFVDDEPKVLRGLRRMLLDRCSEWDMSFVEDPRLALTQLREQEFDVVVSDMRMPDVDGAEVLRWARQLQPRTIRIILSGHTDREAALRALPVAHRYVAKPCEPAELEAAIEQATQLLTDIPPADVRELLGGLDGLPSPPAVYTRLQELMGDPDVEVADLAAVAELDSGMTGQLLHLVNSSFFGFPRRIATVSQALSILGLGSFADLVTVWLLRHIAEDGGCSTTVVDAVQRHSLASAWIARRLVGPGHCADEAFTAGILHDVGYVLLAQRFPERLAEVDVLVTSGARQEEAERQVMGVSHTVAGGCLLEMWGFPPVIVAAVRGHHTLRMSDDLDVALAVRIADILANSAGAVVREVCEPTAYAMAALEETFGSERVEQWRQLAAEAAERARLK